MADSLFALQSDLDMITTQVYELSRSLTTLDWIVQMLKKLDEELTCQGEQMRRMEADISQLKKDVACLPDMKSDIAQLQKDVACLPAMKVGLAKISVSLKLK